ncbi:conserved hypothetical protein [Dehalogenimonas lykanthroporepellens BL-DC-9]|jgi:predicted kinase|nr:conserved hypothetical protein [Dehalogenimonas lykanthroporepellens BL-DC-9]
MMKKMAVPASDVNKIHSLVPPPHLGAVGRPTLVALVGLPGSGKSYLAAKLGQKTPLAVLESDRIRKSIIANPVYSEAEHTRVFNAIYTAAEEYLKSGRDVLIDATNLNRKWRAPLRRIARNTGVRFIIIYLATPRQTARERLAGRSRQADAISDADWEVYQMLEKRMEVPGSPNYIIHPDTDLSTAVEKIAGDINKNR